MPDDNAAPAGYDQKFWDSIPSVTKPCPNIPASTRPSSTGRAAPTALPASAAQALRSCAMRRARFLLLFDPEGEDHAPH